MGYARQLNKRTGGGLGFLTSAIWIGIGLFILLGLGREEDSSAWRVFGGVVAGLGVFRGVEAFRSRSRQHPAPSGLAASAPPPPGFTSPADQDSETPAASAGSSETMDIPGKP